MKDYKEMDYVVIDKKSKEYMLIEIYQNLNVNAKKRMEGYLSALKDME